MYTQIEKLKQIEHGFKPFEQEAKEVVGSNSITKSKEIAMHLLESQYYQLRCCAIFILGLIAKSDRSVIATLKQCAVSDGSWQVQEIIAKAFDHFCAENGYQNSLPEINEWLSDKDPNVCRAVTEGLRIWTSRPYFKDHPQIAIDLISKHKASESEYLRMSVGNSLRDISKKHGELVEKEILGWDLTIKRIVQTYEYVKKRH
ncbi:DNA alkylation repair enzyme [compost metagenome]